jgi:hypothetical protein
MDRAIPEHIAHIDQLLSHLFTDVEEETLSRLLRTLRDHVLDENSELGISDDGMTMCPSAGDA